MNQCERCGSKIAKVFGPATDDDGVLWVLSVERCEQCGTNEVQEKIPVARTINELIAEGRHDRGEENTSENAGDEDTDSNPSKGKGDDPPEGALC